MNVNRVVTHSSLISSLKLTAFSPKRMLALAVSILLLALDATLAVAVPYVWTGNVDNNWVTDGNWDIAGHPDDSADTASLGNISGPYTTTLGVAKTIGGLNLSGTDPTLAVNSTLTIQGGTSTISGGVLGGTGIVRLTNNAAINWTGGSLGGNVSILLPTLQSATINNAPNAFSVGSGQVIRLGDVPIDNQTSTTLTFANGFSNSGELRLGAVVPPGDVFGIYRMVVTAGTLTNNSDGNINMYPRSAIQVGVYGTRELRANVVNEGTITSFTNDGILGGTGLTVTNSGTIQTDHSVFNHASRVPTLTIVGTTFTNTGTLDVGKNDGGFGGGRISLQSTTVNLNTGTEVTGPGNLELAGNTVNIANNVNISGLNALTLGRNTIATTINSGTADLSGTLSYVVPGGANVTWNRTDDWTIANGQSLVFNGPPVGGDNASHLNLAVNVDNSGLIQMGRQPGNNHVQANLTLTGNATFTNNVDGVIDMLVRGPISDDATWNIRNINANVVNNGTINAYASNGRLGASGKTVVNASTINIDSSQFTSPRQAVLQMFGDSFTNNTGGSINLLGGALWLNTPTFNYDGGNITSVSDTGEIRLGSASIDVNFIFGGGAEITDPVTYRIMPDSNNMITRTTTWNVLNGQELNIETYGASGTTGFTINQDISNSGVFNLGNSNPAVDAAIDQRMQFTNASSRFTNNADGVVNMYPRCSTCGQANGDNPWSIRRIEGELVNNGQVNVYTRFGNIGKAGMDHVNNGTITMDKSYYELGSSGFTPELIVTGDSFLNGSAGVIAGNGIFDVNGVTFNNAGTLSPGLSTGILTVQGNLNFQPGGTLYIEIDGENGVAGVDYDQLIVTGNVTGLNQADLVIDISSFELGIDDDTFTILTSATNFAGQEFDSISFIGGTFIYDIEYGNGFIALTNIESFIPEPSSGCLLLLGMLVLRRRNRRPAGC